MKRGGGGDEHPAPPSPLALKCLRKRAGSSHEWGAELRGREPAGGAAWPRPSSPGAARGRTGQQPGRLGKVRVRGRLGTALGREHPRRRLRTPVPPRGKAAGAHRLRPPCLASPLLPRLNPRSRRRMLQPWPRAIGMRPARCSAPCPLRSVGSTAPCPRIPGRASPSLTPRVNLPSSLGMRSPSHLRSPGGQGGLCTREGLGPVPLLPQTG